MSEEVVIVAARRTAIGKFQGAFSGTTATQLGSAAAKAVLSDANLSADKVDAVIFGCVLQAGLGQGPARQVAIGAGIPNTIPTYTINKLCGSGMQSVMTGCDQIRAGTCNVVLAGGTESMTNAPYLLLKGRQGYRMGHDKIFDHMFLDGLVNAYDGKSMGVFADATSAKYGFTREQQDNYSAESVRRAVSAVESGAFKSEIAPISVKQGKQERVVDTDETPFTCDIAKIPGLKAAFTEGGTVTAASSSSISDGAAALLLMSASAAAAQGIKPIARIVAHATHAHAPEWFTTAPVQALKNVLAKSKWNVADVDLFEINEAFACVTMAAIHDVGLDHAKVNVNGGACALGHPIGATGARILVTLIHALKNRGKKRGIAGLCIGGGEATAVAVELL